MTRMIRTLFTLAFATATLSLAACQTSEVEQMEGFCTDLESIASENGEDCAAFDDEVDKLVADNTDLLETMSAKDHAEQRKEAQGLCKTQLNTFNEARTACTDAKNLHTHAATIEKAVE